MKGFSEAAKEGDAYKNLNKQRNVSTAKAAGKIGGTTAVAGTGAAAMFGGKKEADK